MVIYDSEFKFIDSCATLQAKIAAIDAIIDALMNTALQAAGNNDVSEYWLNDGQTQIKTIYKGVDAITRSIKDFEKVRQMYISRLNKDRVTRLIDSKNLPGLNWYGRIFR